MSTKTMNGTGTKEDAKPQTDTQKGAAAMAVTQAKAETPKPTPIAERLKKIQEAQKLTEKRKKLIEAQDKVNKFEEDLDGENDTITLDNEQGETLEIRKPDAVRKIVDLLKADVSTALSQVDAELLSATI